MDKPREYRFDGWTLWPATGELVNGARSTRLQKHPAEILEALLQRPGELVPREALIERLWPRGVVEYDTALNTAVHRLRVALDDRAASPRYIETLPRRGYRFVGCLDAPADAAGALAGPGAAAAESSAPAPADDTRTASPGGNPPIQTVSPASEWRRRRGWSAVSLSVSALMALGGSMAQPDGRAPQAVAAQALQAAEPLARADFLSQRRLPGDLEHAQREYESALRIDPALAPAWAGLAGVHWLRTIGGALPPEDGLARVGDAARRALAIDPGLAIAHLRLANYLRVTGQAALADDHVRKALALEPGNSMMLGVAASLAAGDGRMHDAVEWQRRAVLAAPLSGLARYNLASLLFMSGQVDAAGQELRRLHETQPPTARSRELEAHVLVLTGRCEAALALAEEVPAEVANAEIRALALHCLGRQPAADAALQALVRAAHDRDPLRIAEVHAYRAEADAAFRWLERGLSVGPNDTLPWASQADRRAWMMGQSPLLASIRADPRWTAWLASSRLARSAQTHGVRAG